MKQMKICVCEVCDKPILSQVNQVDGFVCQGNLFNINGEEKIKVIGTGEIDGHETCYCTSCFLHILGFSQIVIDGCEISLKIKDKSDFNVKYVVEYSDDGFDNWIINLSTNDLSLAEKTVKSILDEQSVNIARIKRIIGVSSETIYEHKVNDVELLDSFDDYVSQPIIALKPARGNVDRAKEVARKFGVIN